jgi:hypothetical protein
MGGYERINGDSPPGIVAVHPFSVALLWRCLLNNVLCVLATDADCEENQKKLKNDRH